jgi:hypothetical protein
MLGDYFCPPGQNKPPIMSNNQTTSIQIVGNGGTGNKVVLSRAQKEFNRLTKKIETLERDIVGLRETGDKLQHRIQTELRPLLDDHDTLRAELVRLLDRMHDVNGLTDDQHTKIVRIIREIGYELIEKGHPDLQPIYHKYDRLGLDSGHRPAADEETKTMLKNMFGIDLEPGDDVSTPEKMQAYVQHKIRERREKAGQKKQRTQQQRSTNHATDQPRPLPEPPKQTTTQAMTKAMRTLYMDLVKTFHPDREPDEAEKFRKTDIMQRITAAYEAGNLMALFRLEIELNRTGDHHLQHAADSQLNQYNKLLREQVDELEASQYREQQRLTALAGRPLLGSRYLVEFMFNENVAQLKTQVAQLKADLATLTDLTRLTAWLQTYRLTEA